jgi:hypothetical protein
MTSHTKQPPPDVFTAVAATPRPVDGQQLSPARQAEEQLIAAAAQLIDDRHFRIFNQDEVPSAELIARILCGRQMLTSPELVQAKIDNAHGLTNTLYRSAVTDVTRMTRYIAALQRIANVLLDQVDGVSSLAAVTKTRKGRQLIEQGQAARAFYDAASRAFSESKPVP